MTGGNPRVAVVVGNPKPLSRTLSAAVHVARELSGDEPGLVVDLAMVGPALFDWSDAHVADLVTRVSNAELVVVACPTYKATFTGLLKLFLDRFSRSGESSLKGVAIPLMLGALPAHALAPELSLRPLLTEIGATVPVPGLFVLDSSFDDPTAYHDWLETARPRVVALLHAARTGVQ